MKRKVILILSLHVVFFSFFSPPAKATSSAVNYAQEITNNLNKLGKNCLYNKQPDNKICNSNGRCATTSQGQCAGYSGYLCTQLIVDSYNLAGLENNFARRVYFMSKYWTDKAGYVILRENNPSTTSQLRPGDVFFMSDLPNGLSKNVGNHHVVIIRKIVPFPLPPSGDGRIYLLQANGHATSGFDFVRNWKVKNIYEGKSTGALWFGLAPRPTCLGSGSECSSSGQCCSSSCSYDEPSHLNICR